MIFGPNLPTYQEAIRFCAWFVNNGDTLPGAPARVQPDPVQAAQPPKVPPAKRKRRKVRLSRFRTVRPRQRLHAGFCG
jgi:hypothetical protein